jgi:hypothetical protein
MRIRIIKILKKKDEKKKKEIKNIVIAVDT